MMEMSDDASFVFHMKILNTLINFSSIVIFSADCPSFSYSSQRMTFKRIVFETISYV